MTNLDNPNRAANPDPDAALNADLTTLYRVPVPNMQLDLGRATSLATPVRRPFVLRHWRPALTLTAAAIVAALVIAPSMWGSDATGVSAEEILQRTNAAAEGDATIVGAQRYHLVAKTEFTGTICTADPGSGDRSSDAATPAAAKANAGSPDIRAAKCEANSKDTNTTEIWFGDKGHFRNAQTFAGSKGASTSTFGQAANGADAWIYMSDDTGIRVAHGSTEALGMMWGPGTPDSKSLADVLSQYGKDNCQSAILAGDSTVLGRVTYVIEVQQSAELCDFGDGDTIKRKIDAGDGAPGEKRLSKGGELSTMTVWVDRETFLPLKTETRDADGTLAYGYYVTEIQVGAEIPASAFEYQPPTGATVTEVTSPTEAKRALAGESDTDPGSEPPTDGDSSEQDKQKSLEDANEGTSKDGHAAPIAQ